MRFAALVGVLAALAGAAAFVIAREGGPELAPARIAGEREGERAGTRAGGRAGFAAGRAAGRDDGFERGRRAAYRRTLVSGP